MAADGSGVIQRTSSPAHELDPAWSPDGSKIAFISDMSGEEEIYTVAQDGQSKPVQLTHGGKAQRFSPRWSADGSYIAFRDKDGRLYVLHLADRNLTEIAKDMHVQRRLVDSLDEHCAHFFIRLDAKALLQNAKRFFRLNAYQRAHGSLPQHRRFVMQILPKKVNRLLFARSGQRNKRDRSTVRMFSNKFADGIVGLG